MTNSQKSITQLFPKLTASISEQGIAMMEHAWEIIHDEKEFKMFYFAILCNNKNRHYLSSLNLKAKSYYVVSPRKELLTYFRLFWTTCSCMRNCYLGDLVTLRELIEKKMNPDIGLQELRAQNIFYLYNHKHNNWYGNQGVFHYGELVSFIADRNRQHKLTLLISEEEIAEVNDSGELERIYLDPLQMDVVNEDGSICVTPKKSAPGEVIQRPQSWEI